MFEYQSINNQPPPPPLPFFCPMLPNAIQSATNKLTTGFLSPHLPYHTLPYLLYHPLINPEQLCITLWRGQLMCLLLSDLQYPPPLLFSFSRLSFFTDQSVPDLIFKNLWYKRTSSFSHYSAIITYLPTHLLKTGTPSPPASRLLPPPGSLLSPLLLSRLF
ncbi:hypothetical protein M430DRAFT_189856 [Amorphotheca resinae ATCC 22711]|uniref:Uncharacterized protein n=1 Tax=Amorphotheca resinae ATCC 22711 TaxID=857342 RepID=A0A2T3ARC4_AMORE|nr:hypothetical protein M430DRAFT_189856 [Amorphotheca resinae ATCC 22711]PSS08818.1 hypothetical protein M430DRAFT_189856 [Amorphotheca resinae ATCC 22711]